MSCLIIHHIESQWSRVMKQRGRDFYEYLEHLHDYLQHTNFHKVFLTRMEDTRFEECHYQAGVDRYISGVIEYGYGWEGDGDLESMSDFVQGGTHSQFVWVPEWLRKLPQKIHLCGCFDGECIEDMEIALTSCGKEVIRVEHLIV